MSLSVSASQGPDVLPGEPTRRESHIFSPITLPCGRVVPNRLVKVAMYEHLADIFGGAPNSSHFNLYSRWAQHGWGMVVTGNVQVSPAHLSLGRDLVVPANISEEVLEPFRCLARVIHQERTHSKSANTFNCPLAIMQLSHAGRQSPNILGGRRPFAPPLSPSAIALGSGKRDKDFISDLFHRLLFQTPQSMSLANIDDVVEAFVRGAKLAVLSGFDGVQLHAAHGYLIAQFISPKTNLRADAYSCHLSDGLHFLHQIATSIRNAVPTDFILGVKVNASDYVDMSANSADGLDDNRGNQEWIETHKREQEARALEHIRVMANWRMIDLIEISGGDYETPAFMSPTALATSPRQAFFAQFSRHAMEALSPYSNPNSNASAPLILLTGGLRTPSHLRTAITSRHAHLLGIGRGSVTCPNLPDILRRMEDTESEFVDDPYTLFAPEPNLALGFFGSYWSGRWIWTFMSRIQLIGAGAGMAWYVVMIRRLASKKRDRNVHMDYQMGAMEAILKMWIKTEGPCLATLAAVGFVFFLASLRHCM